MRKNWSGGKSPWYRERVREKDIICAIRCSDMKYRERALKMVDKALRGRDQHLWDHIRVALERGGKRDALQIIGERLAELFEETHKEQTILQLAQMLLTVYGSKTGDYVAVAPTKSNLTIEDKRVPELIGDVPVERWRAFFDKAEAPRALEDLRGITDAEEVENPSDGG